ncbi:2-succinyl-5-enolpyruvyl-6-hydroxy-3-cyclohexene-1-carboxylic-acid synthase [Pseudonocardia asaccharolytica]|uniref:2-succinyl-5-enolpyruvyl-6-hydroxy-3-cyclohexene-1-carboxylate synthase n=1 Tax=Pseudonocardia asaccharolytica DSM 44247 = NBRC 16224 TaxID=1123024 RepID=A0A511CUW5_9PSEU|nr:2-succinyl-5-enolpyruvyl-6-hydroxy-3-cyclohexene-1-carboxylic-acid synthase [Pseudonocardia asaccharolytica]GEL16366.1 2-succinyl-5-enolpyruvyl-6-hydroxy-3-cyclohexene-1-carboxylate synthase [Pseudonocardia asaccharolytica DSM 44247 = NBRC 16224]
MNPSTAQATVIVDELVRTGVTDAVLCPGSRNAPLAFALHAADAAGRLRLHMRIDERAGGFLALGLALRSGRPVPVCTTSGTAVANLHPAVLEAAHAHVPLIALTADRPPQLIGAGASQTITQPGIFGSAVRLAATTAVATRATGEQAHWRSVVDRVVAAATGAVGGPPGPVHLNAPFAEPLVPDGTAGWPEALEGRPDGGPWTAAVPGRRSAPALPLDPGAATLVIAGHGAPPGLDLGGAPLIAEPSSGYWADGLRAGPWLLGAPAAAPLRPAQVVVLGRPTLHRPVQRLLADPAVAVYAVDDPAGAPWTDVAATVRATGSLPALRPPREWIGRWHAADAAAAAALDTALDGAAAPGGPRLARALLASLPGGSVLVLGSSNPIRDVALAAVPRAGVRLLSNRGVAGIDGVVSTAVGVALAGPGRAYALLGDLTLLHDTTGLVIGPGEPRPDLTLIVLNDRGGGIFSLLEQGAPEHAGAFERVFGTPHAVDLAALCAATGVAHTDLADLADLPAAVAPGPGLRMVEVRADRAALRPGHAALRAAVDAAVGRVVAAAA